MPALGCLPVSIEPETCLVQWQVMAIVPDGTCHFIGRNIATTNGRVSSAIEEFDSRTGLGRTFSGRRYRLVGDCDSTGVAQYLWTEWCTKNHIAESIDLTLMYEPESGHDYSM